MKDMIGKIIKSLLSQLELMCNQRAVYANIFEKWNIIKVCQIKF